MGSDVRSTLLSSFFVAYVAEKKKRQRDTRREKEYLLWIPQNSKHNQPVKLNINHGEQGCPHFRVLE